MDRTPEETSAFIPQSDPQYNFSGQNNQNVDLSHPPQAQNPYQPMPMSGAPIVYGQQQMGNPYPQ